MAIYRINYFSKRKKENIDDDELSDKQLGVLAGAGAGYLGSRSAINHLLEKLKRSNNSSKELKNKLIKEANSLGVEVKSNPINDSLHTGNSAWQRKLGEAYKQSKKYERLPDSLKQIIDDLGKDKIHLGKGSFGDADVLSHELGHAKLSKLGRSKNLIGYASHKMYTPASYAGGYKVSALNGFRSGLVAAEKESKGKEESKLNKHSAWALPAISNGIIVTAEGSATHEGLRSLKKAGASAKYMRRARGKLGTALGTYVAGGTAAASLGIGSRELGKIVGKQVYKKKRR